MIYFIQCILTHCRPQYRQDRPAMTHTKQARSITFPSLSLLDPSSHAYRRRYIYIYRIKNMIYLYWHRILLIFRHRKLEVWCTHVIIHKLRKWQIRIVEPPLRPSPLTVDGICSGVQPPHLRSYQIGWNQNTVHSCRSCLYTWCQCTICMIIYRMCI